MIAIEVVHGVEVVVDAHDLKRGENFVRVDRAGVAVDFKDHFSWTFSLCALIFFGPGGIIDSESACALSMGVSPDFYAGTPFRIPAS